MQQGSWREVLGNYKLFLRRLCFFDPCFNGNGHPTRQPKEDYPRSAMFARDWWLFIPFLAGWTTDIKSEIDFQSLSNALRPWPWPNSSHQWKVSAHRWSQTKSDLRVFWRFHCNAIFSCATGKQAQLTARSAEKVPIAAKKSRCISLMRFDLICNWIRRWR